MGLFAAILDAIFHEDDKLAGQRVTRLTTPLLAATTASTDVEATLGFGEVTDGAGDAKLLINGELIYATGRTNSTFTILTRGVDATTIPVLHPISTLVLDVSHNHSALDFLRRGFCVDTALGEDLDRIGANLGLRRCPGLSEAQWREIIRTVAYLPKQTLDAFQQALTALLGAGNFTVTEDIANYPFQVFVEVAVALATSLKGRFFVNGQEPQVTTGLLSVDTDHDINHVLGVYLDNPLTRRGFRAGFTNYATTNTFLGSTVTLDASPGPIGTAVLVDYGAFKAHYLAFDETVQDREDFYPYLADPTGTARCLLNQIRAAGVRVNLSVKT